MWYNIYLSFFSVFLIILRVFSEDSGEIAVMSIADLISKVRPNFEVKDAETFVKRLKIKSAKQSAIIDQYKLNVQSESKKSKYW